MKVCLATTRTLAAPDLGGHAWVFLQWTLGLQANGCDVVWLERLPRGTGPARARRLLDRLRANLESVGVRVPVALVPTAGEAATPGEGEAISLDEAVEGTDLLLDLHYATEEALVHRFPRSALVDLDPGLLQTWMSEGQIAVARHDLHFTIGETVGTPAARFPDAGRRWIHTPPPVCVDAWRPGAEIRRPFTAVTSWNLPWQVFGGRVTRDDKRKGLQPFLDLPTRLPAKVELAIWLEGDVGRRAERRGLERRGWRVRSARRACPNPNSYRAYVASSMGEFGWAKPSYVRLRTAWISDRTLCYLASGRPAIVRHTGASRYLPGDLGLLRWRTAGEAVAAFESVLCDYERHSRAARELACAHFDARRVTARVLERALDLRPRYALRGARARRAT